MPNSTKEQTDRHKLIRELLQRGPISTQQSLVGELGARGLPATQSSISRDLKEIGAIKTAHGYELPQASQASGKEIEAVAGFLRDVTPAGPHLLVIHTAIGAAQRVALALDRSNWSEMIGNIGGDDTVFVATDSANEQKMLTSKIVRAVARASTR
jgi:transcriptional regulator of arginine metabolism